MGQDVERESASKEKHRTPRAVVLTEQLEHTDRMEMMGAACVSCYNWDFCVTSGGKKG